MTIATSRGLRMDTLILRRPFGFTATALAASWYGDGVFKTEKEKQRQQHSEDVDRTLATLPGLVLAIVSGFDDQKRGRAGRDCEWWSVIVFDRTTDDE